jgi:hypothetical protein
VGGSCNGCNPVWSTVLYGDHLGEMGILYEMMGIWARPECLGESGGTWDPPYPLYQDGSPYLGYLDMGLFTSFHGP